MSLVKWVFHWCIIGHSRAIPLVADSFISLSYAFPLLLAPGLITYEKWYSDLKADHPMAGVTPNSVHPSEFKRVSLLATFSLLITLIGCFAEFTWRTECRPMLFAILDTNLVSHAARTGAVLSAVATAGFWNQLVSHDMLVLTPSNGGMVLCHMICWSWH